MRRCELSFANFAQSILVAADPSFSSPVSLSAKARQKWSGRNIVGRIDESESTSRTFRTGDDMVFDAHGLACFDLSWCIGTGFSGSPSKNSRPVHCCGGGRFPVDFQHRTGASDFQGKPGRNLGQSRNNLFIRKFAAVAHGRSAKESRTLVGTRCD